MSNYTVTSQPTTTWYASNGTTTVPVTSTTSWGGITYTSPTSQSNQLDVKGDANIDGNLTVQGVSIKESLERIEERLAILRPNEELEEKWEQLRGLRKMYMELEAEIKEKEQVWKILKR